MSFAIALALLLADGAAKAPIDPNSVTWDDVTQPVAGTKGPWDEFKAADAPPPEKLGPGPHTLVISDGNAMTKVEYATGPKCQRARDVVRLQTDARLTNTNPGVIYGAPRVQAFCVPR